MDDDKLLQQLIDQSSKKTIKTIKSKEKNEYECDKCSSHDTFYETKSAIIICVNCGNVLDFFYDDNPEWRHYDDDITNGGRCSIPINYLLPQSSLGTTIGGTGKNRLKILHSWNAMPYNERSFNVILKQIEEICFKGNIEKKIEQDAKFLCKKVIQDPYVDVNTLENISVIIRGLNRNSIIIGSIFIACRRNGKARSPREIADIAGIDYTNVTSGRTSFSKLAEIKGIYLDYGTSQPEDFIKRYGKMLKINNENIEETIKLSKNIKLLNIASTHTPISIAAACIILLFDIKNIMFDKKKIKEIFNISDVTINKTYKKICVYKNILIDDNITKIVAEELNKSAVKNNSDLQHNIYILDELIEEQVLRIKQLKKDINACI